jgi:hypothetical protein
MSKRFFFFGSSLNGKSPTMGPDGHVRITKLENGMVGGGTQEEHEVLQDHGIKIDEKFKKIYAKHGDAPDARYFEDAMREALSDE